MASDGNDGDDGDANDDITVGSIVMVDDIAILVIVLLFSRIEEDGERW
jgi:hypothetical protein